MALYKSALQFQQMSPEIRKAGPENKMVLSFFCKTSIFAPVVLFGPGLDCNL